jgi:N4-(beta-N-acetylglucosaminyl)-L-asparaginase
MRRGMAPKDAGLEALRRIKAATIERRLLNGRGEPNFNVTFYVLNAKGEHAGVALYANGMATYGVCTENGGESRPIEPLLPGSPE